MFVFLAACTAATAATAQAASAQVEVSFLFADVWPIPIRASSDPLNLWQIRWRWPAAVAIGWPERGHEGISDE
jgi:hypothetical protein